MITIRYEPDTGALRVTGHAGYAACGRDIVCAAVSGILYTLVANLPPGAVETWEPGDLEVFCSGAEERAAAEFCLAGLEWIAKEYPQNVTVLRVG